MTQALFKIKSVKIATLGEYLNKIRIQHNLDIQTLSLLTQIKPAFLVSLEAGSYEQLPAEVYVRGFLKKLAETYRIRESILVEQFEKEYGFEPKNFNKDKEKKIYLTLTPKILAGGISVLTVLAALFYIGLQIKSVVAAPKLEIFDPVSDEKIVGNSLIVSGKAELGAEILINNQAVLVGKNGDFSENLFLSPGLNVIEVSARNKFGKVSKISRQINVEIPPTSIALQPQPLTLTLAIGPGSAWIFLEVDGNVVERGTMLPGSSKTVSAHTDILLTTANAGSTRLIYNGKDLGKLGRENEVIRNVEFSNNK